MTPDADPGRTFIEIEDVAAACHEANRRLQLALGQPASQPWGDAPEWMRLSGIAGVNNALSGATPEQLHQAWCADRVANGWTYGEVKDADAKTHPCLVPYEALSVGDRAKDALFHGVVHALAPLLPPEEDVTHAMCFQQHRIWVGEPRQDGSRLVQVFCGAVRGDDDEVVAEGEVVAERVFTAEEALDPQVVKQWTTEAMESHLRPGFGD